MVYKENALKLSSDAKNPNHDEPVPALFIDTISTLWVLFRPFFLVMSFILECVVYNVNALKLPGDGQNLTHDVLIQAPFVDTMSPTSTLWMLLKLEFLRCVLYTNHTHHV